MSIKQSVHQPESCQQADLALYSNSFFPRGTVRCVGQPLFRSQAARDLACLLDVDPEICSWSCLPLPLQSGKQSHTPDLVAVMDDGLILLDALPAPQWVGEAAELAGYRYEPNRYLGQEQRLGNVKDLLRYSKYAVALGDRVRLLTILEEHGPLPLSSCMQVVRPGSDGVAVVAALALLRLVDIDLDSGPIGPHTQISKI